MAGSVQKVFRFKPEEVQLLMELAKRLKMSEVGVLRSLLRQAAAEVFIKDIATQSQAKNVDERAG